MFKRNTVYRYYTLRFTPCRARYVRTVCAKKNLPLPFNETEWNGPFNETERAVHDPFEVRAYWAVRGLCVFSVRFESVLIEYYYILIAQSALARGSL